MDTKRIVNTIFAGEWFGRRERNSRIMTRRRRRRRRRRRSEGEGGGRRERGGGFTEST